MEYNFKNCESLYCPWIYIIWYINCTLILKERLKRRRDCGTGAWCLREETKKVGMSLEIFQITPSFASWGNRFRVGEWLVQGHTASKYLFIYINTHFHMLYVKYNIRKHVFLVFSLTLHNRDNNMCIIFAFPLNSASWLSFFVGTYKFTSFFLSIKCYLFFFF